MIPRATYRLQLHRDFGFDAAADCVPYLPRADEIGAHVRTHAGHRLLVAFARFPRRQRAQPVAVLAS